MTQDEIIELARQVGVNATGNEYWPFFIEELEAFVKLVAEKEREACAKVCDDELKEWGIFDSDVGDVSKAIRARGQV
jgi:hypothetical protein